jgi:hypothetical protein
VRIFIFKSESRSDLGAFAATPDRHDLPSKFGPWAAVGVVPADKAPPHRLDRKLIEREIELNGFQLFRTRPKSAASE